MNRLSQAILPLALGLGLAIGSELPANAFPRNSHHRSRSRTVIISPSRDKYDDYSERDYGRDIRYSRRDHAVPRSQRVRYDDYYDRDYGRRRRRSSRYDCGPRNRRVGRRRRRYYSGQEVNVRPRIYRDSPSNSRSIRVIRY